MELTQAQKEMLAEVIARSTVEAMEGGEAIRIAMCMPPCLPIKGGCPLCEIVVVLPNGTVMRELKGH